MEIKREWIRLPNTDERDEISVQITKKSKSSPRYLPFCYDFPWNDIQ